MRRALLTCVLALLLFPAAAGAASVRLVECVPALEPADRSATFEARVHPVRGSERMQVRFALQVREGGLQGWRRVAASELDEWLTSFPDVRRFSYSRTVRNLSAPASYRMVVRFRWLGDERSGDEASGRGRSEVVRRSRATSRACRQHDMRPDLVATEIAPVAGGYEVALRNNGRTGAGPFEVALAAGALALEPVALEGLAAGERRTVSISGPACLPGEPLTATVDGADAVDERDEDGNVLVALCPA
jgi:CARDB